MFKIGDKVRCIDDGGPHQRFANKVVRNGRIYTITDINKSYYGNENYLHFDNDGVEGGWYERRFEKVEDEPAAPDLNEFISNKAKQLALAIDNGTMTGYYSALGFLVQTLQELSAYTQE